MRGVIFGCLIYFWLWRHVGHSVWRKEKDRESERGRRSSSHSKPGVVGRGGRGEGRSAAFQRGMMEVFVIGRRDEMRRVGTDGATDEGRGDGEEVPGA